MFILCGFCTGEKGRFFSFSSMSDYVTKSMFILCGFCTGEKGRFFSFSSSFVGMHVFICFSVLRKARDSTKGAGFILPSF